MYISPKVRGNIQTCIMKGSDPLSQSIWPYCQSIVSFSEKLRDLHDEVGEETMKEFKETIFWKTLETSRTLVAHLSYTKNADALATVIAINVRNLIRLVGSDIAERKRLRSIEFQDQIKYWIPLEGAKSKWMPLRGQESDSLIEKLQTTTMQTMKDEIVRLANGSAKISFLLNHFGYITYHLLVTKGFDDYYRKIYKSQPRLLIHNE
jgi:hypothetical protein